MEIKYKMWWPLKKEMSPGAININQIVKNIAGNAMNGKHIRELMFRNAYDVVFIQSTGLIDKNNKEIFDGDIVKYFNNDGSIKYIGKIMHSIDHGLKRVKGFHDHEQYEFLSSFGIVDKDDLFEGICYINRPYQFMEVIGNIYETPELLL